MKLRYHHVTIKVRSHYMPYRLWRYLLDSLNIVYAAYGLKREGPNEPHVLYMLYEDDAYLRSFGLYLESRKSRIVVFREENDLSEQNLLNVRETYDKISPRNYRVDNIDYYI